MATSRNVGMVAVGVDTTVVLKQLAGAASGAAKMATWLRAQSTFGVASYITELTDANNGKVSARQVQDAVRALIARGDLDLLILYFAGHGLVKSGFDEQVLLSDVGTYKDEAIAIAPTALNAFYSTVPHVILVSDACRSAVDPFSALGAVAGKPALDRQAVVGVSKSKVDLFYATEPSQTAKEFDGDGFFTEVLLDALQNPPASVSEVWPGLDAGVAVVPAWKLEPYLGVQVPLRAAQQTPSFDQTPDFTITSRQPQFFGYAKAAPATRSEPPPGAIAVDPARLALVREVQKRSAALTDIGSAIGAFASAPSAVDTQMFKDAGLAQEIRTYVGSEQGRDSFETGTGYSVLGGTVVEAMLCGGTSGDLARTSEGSVGRDVRIAPSPDAATPNGQRGSIALFFAGGTVAILPILPGYIGTLGLRDGRIASLSFEVSAQLRAALGESENERQAFAERRALAAALSASGKLQRLARGEGVSYAGFLRESKRADPTLGIYSAYAYALSGNDEAAASIDAAFLDHPSLDPATRLPRSPVPFDVAMLAHRISPETAMRAPGFAPFCPMMTLGWSLMPSYIDEGVLHPSIVAAGKARLNAEWTTFRQRDVKPMLDAFERGELQ